MELRLGALDGEHIALSVFLTVLTHPDNGGGRVATDNKDCCAGTAFHEHPRRVTFYSLKGAWNASLPMQGAQGDAEHRPIHIRAILGAQTGRHHLDEADPCSPLYRLVDRRTSDKDRHPVVDQPGHHVAWVVLRLRARGTEAGGCLHEPMVAPNRG